MFDMPMARGALLLGMPGKPGMEQSRVMQPLDGLPMPPGFGEQQVPRLHANPSPPPAEAPEELPLPAPQAPRPMQPEAPQDAPMPPQRPPEFGPRAQPQGQLGAPQHSVQAGAQNFFDRITGGQNPLVKPDSPVGKIMGVLNGQHAIFDPKDNLGLIKPSSPLGRLFGAFY
jgi:hypothetical protein